MYSSHDINFKLFLSVEQEIRFRIPQFNSQFGITDSKRCRECHLRRKEMLCFSRKFSPIIEPESSVLHLQEPICGLSLEPKQFIPHSHILFPYVTLEYWSSWNKSTSDREPRRKRCESRSLTFSSLHNNINIINSTSEKQSPFFVTILIKTWGNPRPIIKVREEISLLQ
jgi:hypothetical protein